MDTAQIAAAIVTAVASFTPFLVDMGKAAGKKFAETIAAKGGEATWKKAQELWGKVQARFGDDPEINGATMMLVAKPENEKYQTQLAELLATHLKDDHDLAREFLALLGGQDALQQILADRSSWVEDVIQRMKGGGTQTAHASDDSVIKGVQQIKE